MNTRTEVYHSNTHEYLPVKPLTRIKDKRSKNSVLLTVTAKPRTPCAHPSSNSYGNITIFSWIHNFDFKVVI